MDAAGLKMVADLAKEASPDKRIVRTDAEPSHWYYVTNAAGELVRTEAMPKPLVRQAADIDTLCRVANSWSGHEPQVWYSRNGITAVLEPDVTAPSVCQVKLTPSPQLVKLMEWDRAGKVFLTQAEFVTLLRTMFVGCVPGDLLTVIRAVKATKGQEVNQQIAQGKVSMSKSAVAEMTGTAAIPETVVFQVPIFAQSAVNVLGQVPVEIDPDPENNRFALIVHPGAVEIAQARAEEELQDRIVVALGDGSTVLVYRGNPS